jgi:tetratricopeptide (TPR) repeat protein
VSVGEKLSLGYSYHQAGDLLRAEQAYREVLSSEPDQPQALFLLGTICHAQGRLAEAVASYERAVHLCPNDAQVRHNLGAAYFQLDRLDLAAACFQEVLRLNPDSADACYSLAMICERQGNQADARRFFEEAIPRYQQMVRTQPDSAQAHYHLGLSLSRVGRRDDAVGSLREAVRLLPGWPEAQNDLGYMLAECGQHREAESRYREAVRLRPEYAAAHNNLGLILVDSGRVTEGMAHYQTALRHQPDFPEAHNNLGLALAHANQPAEAIPHYQEAVRLKPTFAEAYCAWGRALAQQDRLDDAVGLYQKAIQINPDLHQAYTGMGWALEQVGKRDEALKWYDRVLQLKPDYADARVTRAMLLLLEGKLDQAWPDYEWRWKIADRPEQKFPQPVWDGSPLGGRTIFLHTEQGLGDTIQFLRYAPLVKQRGGRVIVGCQQSLLRLLARSPGIDQLVGEGSSLPSFDVHAPLLSLSRIFQTAVETIPASVPYVFAEPYLIASWRQELSRLPGFKIGIAWQGNPEYQSDRERSIPLRFFAPLAKLPQVHLISLQKGPGVEQLGMLEERFPVLDLSTRLDLVAGAFMDTAAIMMNLDLVIASDIAVPHLAGALRVPVWVPLATMPDWRWLLDREDSPWYPTMRLFRQRQRGDWAEVFERIAHELRNPRGSSAVPSPVGVAPRSPLSPGTGERGGGEGAASR